MSTLGKLRKKVKGYAKSVGRAAKGAFGFGSKGSDDSSRSEAAGQLMKRDVGITKQAGSGQIKYTGEEDVLA